MSWNKKSISSTAPLHQIAQKFSLKENVGRSPHMRAKLDGNGDIKIFSKHFDVTKFRAILGSKAARAEIANQRILFRQTIESMLETEFLENTAHDIRLQNHAPLRGYQIEAMQAHAAVAAAAEQMGLNRHEMNDGVRQAVCQLARDHVYEMKPDQKASNRIAEAKVFIVEKLAEYRLTALFKDQSAETLNNKIRNLRALCRQLEYSPLSTSLNMRVVTGLVSLLASDERPSMDNLLSHIAASRQNRRDQTGPAQQA